ncbi:Smr/MutS family protein [Muriicola sp.]|uniref:Smr/MutS family protein n=1 Tax=Muriicola sp. TaxID=2020856 RepID=UPI0035631B24
MAKIKAGDRVQVLDDSIEGVVMQVVQELVRIRTDEGFDLEFTLQEVLLVEGQERIRVSRDEVNASRLEKEVDRKPGIRVSRKKERDVPAMEVDLHIHQLVPDTRGMSNYEMLNIQMDTAKRQLEFALRKNIRRVVFIHGVGAGVLKEELGFLLRRYPQINYYDADYQKYGLGATEAYILQNPREN